MVEVGAAGGRVKDTRLVELERKGVGLDGDGDGLLGNGGLELRDGVGGDVGIGVNEVGLLGGIRAAAAGDAGARGVRIVSLGLIGGLLEVLESGVLPATLATVGDGVAGNDLLLGHGDELTGVDGVGALEGGDGGESPAGTAASLVLDGVDGTLGPPVDLSIVGLGELNNVLLRALAATHDGGELLGGPGGELVVGKHVRSILGVVLVDEGVLLGEELHAEVVLLGGGERKAVLVHVSLEAGVHEVLGQHELGADGALDTKGGHRVAEVVHHLFYYYNYLPRVA